jgi:hypothetical protein
MKRRSAPSTQTCWAAVILNNFLLLSAKIASKSMDQKILQQLIDHAARKLEGAMDVAVDYGQSIATVDTSSYQQTIRREGLDGTGLIRTGAIAAGGLDFTGQILSTGKEGKLVDYADEREAIDGTLGETMGVLIAEVENW